MFIEAKVAASCNNTANNAHPSRKWFGAGRCYWRCPPISPVTQLRRPLTVTPSFGLSQQIQVLWNAHILKQMARIRADYVPQPHINQVGGLTYQ